MTADKASIAYSKRQARDREDQKYDHNDVGEVGGFSRANMMGPRSRPHNKNVTGKGQSNYRASEEAEGAGPSKMYSD